jgi:hypothetical protein
MGSLEVIAMADHRSHDRVRSMGRKQAGTRVRAGSTYASERLIAELRQLGRELIDEPVPPRLVDIVRSGSDRKRDEQRSPRPTRRAASS